MSPNLTTVLVSCVLIGTGTYLFLSRSLVRALMGFLLMGNGVNLLFIIASGPAGAPPIVGEGEGPMADPVPQALVLTAIVITLGMTAFVLALAHRGRQLSGLDLVDDDTESARIHARAEADELDSPSPRYVTEQIAAEGERTESRRHWEIGDSEMDGAETYAIPRRAGLSGNAEDTLEPGTAPLHDARPVTGEDPDAGDHDAGPSDGGPTDGGPSDGGPSDTAQGEEDDR